MPQRVAALIRSFPLAAGVPKVAFGIAAVAVAVLIRVPLEPVLAERDVFIVLAPAIAVAAWYGGLNAGLAATIAAVVASAVLYLPPIGSPGVTAESDILTLGLIAVDGLILSFISSAFRGTYERATLARVRAESVATQSDRLQRFALALNRPMSTQVLAQTAIDQAVDALGASGGLIAAGRIGEPEFRVLATQGYTGDTKTGGSVVNRAENPLGDAIRTGEPSVFHGKAERQARYPTIARRFKAEGDSIVIPLLYEGLATGAIYLNFKGASGFGPSDREFLRSIGAQVGSALERSLVTERADRVAASQQARAAELTTVVEAIGDGILVGDADGKVILANPAVERLLGRVPAQLSDLPSRPADAHDDTTSDRFLVRSPMRPRGWLEIAHFAAAGGTTSDVVLLRDVSQAVEADLQRDAFLGVLSHELRTPITTIVAGIDLLRDGQNLQDARSRELLSDIDVEATRLHRIVDDLLVLTRSERGALDVSGEPVLVHRLVKNVVDREQQTSRDVKIRLTAADDLAPVAAEPTYVQQIVRNLLSNALKYGRSPGQPIDVEVRQGEGVMETRVLDRGVGLSPGDSERVFSLFYRNPKAVRSAPGAGIGLYVCRLLAEAMGGTIWARSRPGGGADFGFALPLMAEVGAAPERASEQAPVT